MYCCNCGTKIEYVKKPKFCANCGFSLDSTIEASQTKEREIEEKEEIPKNYDRISSLNIDIDIQHRRETVGSILAQSSDTPPIDLGRDRSPVDEKQTLSDFQKEAGTLRPKK